MLKCLKVLVAAAALLGAVSTSHAAMIINIWEENSNVNFLGSGKINLGSLTLTNQTNALSAIDAWHYIGIGGPNDGHSVPIDVYDVSGAFSSAGKFGTGVLDPTLGYGSGDYFGIVFGYSPKQLYVPRNYVSNTQLNFDAVHIGNNLSNLGLWEGTYVYSWGSGATADSVTINISATPPGGGASAVPEPGSVMLMGSGLLGMLGFRRRELLAYFKR